MMDSFKDKGVCVYVCVEWQFSSFLSVGGKHRIAQLKSMMYNISLSAVKLRPTYCDVAYNTHLFGWRSECKRLGKLHHMVI